MATIPTTLAPPPAAPRAAPALVPSPIQQAPVTHLEETLEKKHEETPEDTPEDNPENTPDAVRRAVADLQAVLVRRFLRLCASKDGHEEPDSALKDALRVVRGAASREVVRRKALCAALHDAQYKAADGVLGRIPVHKSFWGPSKLWWCCRVMLCASDVYVRALLEDSFWSG